MKNLIFLFFLFNSGFSIAATPDFKDVVDEVKSPFPGYMYKPKNMKKAPVILLLHGSKGGNGDFWYFKNEKIKTGDDAMVPWLARYYASRGYVTMALCYFDCKHHTGITNYPPDELVKVDIQDHVIKPFLWLKENYSSNKKMALWGMSRGAELALLTAQLLEQNNPSLAPDLLIALSPPDIVAASYPKKAADAMIAGEKPDFSNVGSIASWTSGAREFLWKEPINLSKYKHPFLITYFTTDYVWGKFIDAAKLTIPFKDDAESKLLSLTADAEQSTDIDFQKTKKVFIQLNKTGHGYDKKNAPEFRVQVKAINKSVDHFLR